MKKSLMAATAVAALIAGTSLASAEEMKGNAAGQAPATQMHQGGQMQRGADTKAQPGMDSQSRKDNRAQERSLKDPATKGAESTPVPGSRRSTTGQGSAEDRTPGRAQQDEQRSSQPQNTQREQRDEKNAQSPGHDRNNNRAQSENRGEHKPLTAEQKTKIRTTVISRAPKVSNVNFSINVGTVVPRSVNIVAVPPTLIEYYPQWRGYRYFVVGDEIIIVEPRTLRIVAVLDV